MMMIKKLKMWRNPGYTEECIEIPPIGSRKLPAADWVNQKNGQFYDLRPRKGSTLSKIELPLSFSATWDMSYLWMQAEDDAGNIEVFGWIRSVEQIAGSEEAVRIMWVPDYWRTCSGSVSFGKGIITKTNNSTYARPLRVQPRRWTVKEHLLVGEEENNRKNAVVIGHVKNTKDGQGNITKTEIEVMWWYIGETNTPPITDIYDGLIEEDLGLDPNSIIGVWLTPVAPASYAGTHTHGTFTVNVAGTSGSGSVAHVFQTPLTIDSTNRIVVSDYNGAVMGELPYGYTITGYVAQCDFGSSGCNVIINFSTDSNTHSGQLTPEEGLRISLPCPSLPVTSNAWSSYVYSGQRENDIQLRIINREQKAISGLTGSATSAVSGALTGALVGAAGGPIGAAAGATIGLATSLMGTGIEYATQGAFDDRLQAESDKLYSNQSANVILPAAGSLWRHLGIGTCAVVILEADAVSKAEMTAFITNQGYDVEIPVSAASGFISSGPVQIRNLNVTGSVPPAAKTAIKAKLEAGVFIVENNPTGSDPAN